MVLPVGKVVHSRYARSLIEWWMQNVDKGLLFVSVPQKYQRGISHRVTGKVNMRQISSGA